MTVRQAAAVHEGTVARLRVDEAAGAAVVRFVLHSDDGSRRPVEMRGERLSGLIEEGDRVRIEERTGRIPNDATLRPSTLYNVSTGGAVELERPTRTTRVRRAVGLHAIWTAAVGGVVGSVTGALVSGIFKAPGASDGQSVDGNSSEGIPFQFVVVFLLFVFVLFAAVWLVVRRVNPERLPKWSVLVGFAVGLLAVGLALA
jgi:hypothetical protein